MLPASRRRSTLLLVLAIALLATACLPSETAAGRPGPVRKVALLGDSLTFGLFGTTPGVADPLRERLGASGLSVTIDGGPGDTLQTPWPGHANWADLLQTRVDQDDPDVVIIQSILFPGAENPANHDSYLRAAQKLIDIGQSRGAHVYFVQHHRPNNSTEFNAAEIAERLQGIAAEGRGIGVIPMNWWIARCASPYAFDGWHLSGNGVRCWADAANAAINQLRNERG